MNISIVITDISRTGGTERAVVTLANMLCKKNNNVKIISLTKTQIEKSYYKTDDRVFIQFLNNKPLPIGLLSKIKWCLQTIKLLRNYFKKEKANFIVSTGHNNNWLLPFLKDINRTKIIACEHIVYSSIPKVSRFFMFLTYWLLDRIVVLSEKAKESFVKYSNVSVIPNAIPFETNEESQLLGKQILIVGRLSAEKGLERLIPLGSHLKNNFSDWKIIVVGDGVERKKLERLIEEANLADIILLKGMRVDVQKFYLQSSIYIMTSYFEAFPMVLIEAQSFGLPIIAFDCPEGPSQIITNEENGYLIEEGKIRDFIEKVSVLIENDSMRKRFGKNAKLNSIKYSETEIVKYWLQLFDKLENS